jgi:DNA-binding Xre family transcriptional regulator
LVATNAARAVAPREYWRAVAQALNARMAARRVGQQELADRAGVSVATLRVLQRGTGDRRVQDATLGAVSRALDWPAGYLLAVLVGRTLPAGTVDASPVAPAGQAEIIAILRRIEKHVETLARGGAPA